MGKKRKEGMFILWMTTKWFSYHSWIDLKWQKGRESLTVNLSPRMDESLIYQHWNERIKRFTGWLQISLGLTENRGGDDVKLSKRSKQVKKEKETRMNAFIHSWLTSLGWPRRLLSLRLILRQVYCVRKINSA